MVTETEKHLVVSAEHSFIHHKKYNRTLFEVSYMFSLLHLNLNNYVHLNRPCCWERLKAKGEEGGRG